MRIATYNVEWFHELFDRSGALLHDGARSGREGVSRGRQIDALATVFRAIDADAIMVVEAPDISRRHDGETALKAFARSCRASAPVRCCMVSRTTRSRNSCCFTIPT
jgi:hypothetical protein